MSTYACLHTHVYIRMSTYACLYARPCMRMYVYTHEPKHVHTQISICMFIHIVYTHVYTHVDTHVYTHAHMHVYMHVYMHAYTQTQNSGNRGALPAAG